MNNKQIVDSHDWYLGNPYDDDYEIKECKNCVHNWSGYCEKKDIEIDEDNKICCYYK